LRRRKVQPLADEDQTSELADTAPRPDEQLEAAAQSRQVADALAALPDRQREAIVLQYYQGLSNIEAAALLNISVEALESLLSRARRTLRNTLAAHRGDARPGGGQ
jgi:RNA polymerase sigma-70 factor (ECF subfamily)